MKKNAKHIASVSLGVMGAGFVATFPVAHLPVGFILQTGFEAGLVGGLADWFAVTALFRHPLGIPIPHTALLPRNREKVTNALVTAIQSNLLQKERIIEKLATFRLADLLMDKGREWLEKEEAAEKVSAFLRSILELIPPEELAAAVTPAVRGSIRSFDAATLLERIGVEVLERQWEERAFDYLVEQGRRLALTPEMRWRLGRMAMRAIDQLQIGGFMGFAVNAFAGFMNEDKLGGLLQEGLLSMLNDLAVPGEDLRESVLASIRETIRGLGENERLRLEAEEWKERLAEGEELDAWIFDAVKTGWGALCSRLADPNFCRDRIFPYLHKALDGLQGNRTLISRIDEWVLQQAAVLVEKNHSKIGKFMKENADQLDNETLIAMIEKHVGKDLQWIRVNGALCGFVIGILLGALQWVIA